MHLARLQFLEGSASDDAAKSAISNADEQMQALSASISVSRY